jgi:hypothetical protein
LTTGTAQCARALAMSFVIACRVRNLASLVCARLVRIQFLGVMMTKVLHIRTRSNDQMDFPFPVTEKNKNMSNSEIMDDLWKEQQWTDLTVLHIENTIIFMKHVETIKIIDHD